MRVLISTVAAALLLPTVYSGVVPLTNFCKNPRVVSTYYTGKENDIRVEHTACDEVVIPAQDLVRRQAVNACGSPCKSQTTIISLKE